MTHPLDNFYRGKPIFVLGTGPSLRNFDFARLNGQITVGVNRVIEHYHPTVMHFIDTTAHVTFATALEAYEGMIIAGPGAAPKHRPGKTFEINPGGVPLEPRAESVAALRAAQETTVVGRSFGEAPLFGDGGGCTALHVAILLGGDPIYLLGYDYYEENGRYFDREDPSARAGSVYSYSRSCIERLGREEWLPRIFNCNRETNLRCFPFKDIGTALGTQGPAGATRDR
jgi:hypothetical protein